MQSISGDSLMLFYWAKVCGINTLSYLRSSVSVQGNKKSGCCTLYKMI